jgi:flagellar biosynthesis/type III secretory pathway protein FliH
LTAFAPENDSLNDARNEIIWYLCAVFDAGKLEWFAQVVSTGLQLEQETPMPTIYEALIERGVVQGIEKGIEQGIEKGIEQGIEKGIEKGVIIGRIRTLQEVLQQPVASQEELVSLSHDELQQRAQQLQGLLRDRPA